VAGFTVKKNSRLGRALKKRGPDAAGDIALGGPAGILGPIKASSSRLGKFLLGEAGKDVLPYGASVRLRPTQMKEAFRGIDPNTKIFGISQNEVLQNLKEAKIGAQMRRALRKKIVKHHRKGNTEKLVDPAQRKN